jgi:hypothetical protein
MYHDAPRILLSNFIIPLRNVISRALSERLFVQKKSHFNKRTLVPSIEPARHLRPAWRRPRHARRTSARCFHAMVLIGIGRDTIEAVGSSVEIIELPVIGCRNFITCHAWAVISLPDVVATPVEIRCCWSRWVWCHAGRDGALRVGRVERHVARRTGGRRWLCPVEGRWWWVRRWARRWIRRSTG